MPFTTFKGEKSIHELVARLFPSRDKGSKTAAKQVVSALLKANPQLHDLDKVAAGSLLVVPDTLPPIASSEHVAASSQVVDIAVNAAQQSMRSLEGRIATIDLLAQDAAKSILAVQQIEFPQELEDLPDLFANVSFAGKPPGTESDDSETAGEALTGVFASLRKHIAALGHKLDDA
jgi:hypothetical protein